MTNWRRVCCVEVGIALVWLLYCAVQSVSGYPWAMALGAPAALVMLWFAWDSWRRAR